MVEINGERKSFIKEEDAFIYMFDQGVKTYQSLTKKTSEYKSLKQVPIYEFWHIENRVGHVLYDYEYFVDENGETQKRKAYIRRFVGFGRSCFASTKEELMEKVRAEILIYKDPGERGFNTYPYYTRYYRE
ncbi:hypothetical protein V7149_21680 [Bacillus sp. JJ1503]|uniref:hypothetical protein n=1 Tax=Bacillus sp. JJ1503 TaxID=3122956 RepID=UPI003000D78A